MLLKRGGVLQCDLENIASSLVQFSLTELFVSHAFDSAFVALDLLLDKIRTPAISQSWTH